MHVYTNLTSNFNNFISRQMQIIMCQLIRSKFYFTRCLVNSATDKELYIVTDFEECRLLGCYAVWLL
jgi:hypothetical protein